jgi:hypothetical protein
VPGLEDRATGRSGGEGGFGWSGPFRGRVDGKGSGPVDSMPDSWAQQVFPIFTGPIRVRFSLSNMDLR